MAHGKQSNGRQKRRRTKAVRSPKFHEGQKEIDTPWRVGELYENLLGRTYPIAKGTIVRGNYSQVSYRIEHVGDSNDGTWWASGRVPDLPLQCGWFALLGKRNGNEIDIVDEKRPDDRLIIVKEPRNRKAISAEKSLKPVQALFDFMKK